MINMLYKKYHRDYVRQFKKGIKFRCEGFSGFKEVVIEPFIVSYRYVIHVDVMVIQNGDIGNFPEHWTIVFTDGRLGMNMKLRLKFIEDAV